MINSSLIATQSPQICEKNVLFREYLDSLSEAFPFNKKLTLIHCPTFSFTSFNIKVAKNRAFYAYPPVGLQCLKSALSPLGIDVDILDLNFLLLEKALNSQNSDLKKDLNLL